MIDQQAAHGNPAYQYGVSPATAAALASTYGSVYSMHELWSSLAPATRETKLAAAKAYLESRRHAHPEWRVTK